MSSLTISQVDHRKGCSSYPSIVNLKDDTTGDILYEYTLDGHCKSLKVTENKEIIGDQMYITLATIISLIERMTLLEKELKELKELNTKSF